MHMTIPHDAEWIIDKIRKNGFEAFAVGGCVRDTLLGREPGDWDITTSAKPEEVKKIFGKTVDTGLQHGTVTVIRSGIGYEVTTYRIDGEYQDGRHPESVEFTSNLKEDLKRRDFTINAMAYSHETGIVDEFGGMEDLEHRIIRCVGLAHDRFTEDALRILRAIRFAAQLGFEIEEETYRAIADIAPNLKKVSKERIQVEMTKLLQSNYPEKVVMVEATGISSYVTDAFPGVFAKEQEMRGIGIPSVGACGATETVWCSSGASAEIPPVGIWKAGGNERCRAADMLQSLAWTQEVSGMFAELKTLPDEKSMRWAGFLRHMSPNAVRTILKGLKLDTETIDNARMMVEAAQMPLAPEKPAIRRFLSRMSSYQFEGCLNLKTLDGDTDVPEIRRLWAEIIEDGDCISLKTLQVNGGDLIKAGVKPGKQFGELLAWLLDQVLEDPEMNQKEILLERLAERVSC